MLLKRIVLSGAVLLLTASPLLAKIRSERDRLRGGRARLLHRRDDALPRCHPGRAKVTACMTMKRAQLSPACGKVFDRGIKS